MLPFTNLLTQQKYELNEEAHPVRIAVIDSGIDNSIDFLSRHIELMTGFDIDSKGQVYENAAMKVNHTHGTGVACIILSLCSKIKFVSINILNSRLRSDGRILIHAIRHAINCGVDIINLSLGTTNPLYWFNLQRIMLMCRRKGIIVVAAGENRGKRSYPSSTWGVVRVAKNCSLTDNSKYTYSNGWYFGPHSANGLEAIQANSLQINGNSAAAAFITGHIANLQVQKWHGYISNILKTLKSNASIYIL